MGLVSFTRPRYAPSIGNNLRFFRGLLRQLETQFSDRHDLQVIFINPRTRITDMNTLLCIEIDFCLFYTDPSIRFVFLDTSVDGTQRRLTIQVPIQNFDAVETRAFAHEFRNIRFAPSLEVRLNLGRDTIPWLRRGLGSYLRFLQIHTEWHRVRILLRFHTFLLLGPITEMVNDFLGDHIKALIEIGDVIFNVRISGITHALLHMSWDNAARYTSLFRINPSHTSLWTVILNDNIEEQQRNRNVLRRIAFLMGAHPRLGRQSIVYTVSGESALLAEILQGIFIWFI